MRYSIFINQVKSLEWDLKIAEASLFSLCYDLHSWADKLTIGNEVYYFASKNMIANEIPIVSKKPDTIYRHLKKLVQKGLIEFKKIDGKDYVRVTKKGSKWNESLNCKSDSSEKNPNELGKKSENNSDKFPTYKNTNTNQNTNDNKNLFSFVSEEFKESFELWLKYKKERKQSYKGETSLKTAYKKLIEYSLNDPVKAMAIVEKSIANNYSGIFPYKESQNTLFPKSSGSLPVSNYDEESL